ncbi:NADH dehydrogenase [ubiquinone] 1 beta subcomplex subunit 7 [Colletes gigas]|uniref:NADH dehydrogenase [ubiquinone] 1 beta subcomplex subunit 7 n=1 Tax=Colletes gigas TaxID=935657 RepID=UPI001C9AB0CA|nr:NADH dehydrogenase [ubiquinone] 1 beta subcomplex subunit 7 [Colletes gigas]
MGNALKTIGSSDFPESEMPPSFDPNLGFPNGRKKRVMVASEQEINAARVPTRFRDYCSHKYLDLEDCSRRNFPIHQRCNHEFHGYVQCINEDYILREKEYERERRLRRRQKRKEEAMKKAAAV